MTAPPDPRALIAAVRAIADAADAAQRKYDAAMADPYADHHVAILTLKSAASSAYAQRDELRSGVDLIVLLDGYAAALDEVARLERDWSTYNNYQLRSEFERLKYADVDQGKRIAELLAEIVALRTSIAEQALVVEQQDRDMARMRTALTNLRGHIDRDHDCRCCVDDIDAILNGGT